MNSSYIIRTMTRQELDIAVGWAAAEGWNPGLHDADCFHAAGPNGFLIGLLDDEPVSVISAVKYGGSFGFIGFYMVKPEYRGQGYGIQIWNAALAYLGNRTIGLDGVVAQQDNYRKSGFVLANNNVRYQGIGGGNYQTDAEIVALSTLPFDELYTYDKLFFPDDRKQFLSYWIRQPESTALGILQDGKLSGYGILRICHTGYKIGPLFADNPELAEYLFLALMAQAPQDAPVFLDIPASNSAAVDMAQRHNMTAVFETARMYIGTNPNLPINKIFGVTTFELG